MGNKLSSRKVISVEAEFEILNGLSGMKRDVILRLCVSMNSKPRNIRSIFGISKENMIWRGHHYFISHRKRWLDHLPMEFLKVSGAGVAKIGSRVVWESDDYHTYLVGQEMPAGVYRITFQKNGNEWVAFGLAAKGLLRPLADSLLCDKSSGTCCIYCAGIYCGRTQQVYVRSHFFPSYGKATVGLELDTDRRVLRYFADSVQIPHCVVDVPSAAHFAVSASWKGATVEINAFARLVALSAAASRPCAEYRWK